MTVLKKDNLINMKTALRIAKGYPDGPKTVQGLIWAIKKAGIGEKDLDGFHWLIDKEKLKRYCELAGKPTLSGIAEMLGVGKGSIKYYMLKNQISFRIELGRKYLEEEDALKIINNYKG
jgi:hypothetical protein